MKDTIQCRIGKRGIAFKDEFYVFEGYENHYGALVTFFAQEDYLVVALEGEVFHARKRDI